MRDTFARTIYDVAKKTNDVFVLVADISPAGSMGPFRAEYPDRFINVGVAEQTMIGLAAGLALRGFRPFAYTIATFSIYRPFEQVRVDVCYHDLPVTMVGIGGGITYSTLGGTHHAQEDIAVMSGLPNMTVLAPCDPAETAAATWAAARASGPVYLRLGKAGEPDLTAEAPDPFVMGKIRRIRQGRDVCILSFGTITKMACDVAVKIEADSGGSVAVVSVHTLKPLDREGIARVLGEFDTVLVVEEHAPYGGLSAQVGALAYESGARCRLQCFSLQDRFIHAYGSHAYLLDKHGLSVDRITRAALAPAPGRSSVSV
ncbi:MAG: transketolase [Acidimicrobiia bacterium]|nr:transketolase [Acidimicrobiia bacterium]